MQLSRKVHACTLLKDFTVKVKCRKVIHFHPMRGVSECQVTSLVKGCLVHLTSTTGLELSPSTVLKRFTSPYHHPLLLALLWSSDSWLDFMPCIFTALPLSIALALSQVSSHNAQCSPGAFLGYFQPYNMCWARISLETRSHKPFSLHTRVGVLQGFLAFHFFQSSLSSSKASKVLCESHQCYLVRSKWVGYIS